MTMKLADIPIRRRLMIVILFTSVVVMILMRGHFLRVRIFCVSGQATVRQIATLAKITANNSTAALAFDNPSDARDILSSLASESHLVAVCLYDKTGRIFAKFPVDLPGEAFPVAPGPEGFQFGDSYLSGFQPVIQGSSGPLGTLYMVI